MNTTNLPSYYQNVALPSSLVRGLSIIIRADGESMSDFDVHDGDELSVRLQSSARTDDVIIADCDGEIMLKSYYRDRDGEYLVSHSDRIAPLLFSEHDVRIIGVVRQIVQSNLRADGYISRAMVENYKSEQKSTITDDKLRSAINEISHRVKTKRAWFAIYRVLVDADIIADSAWTDFIDLLNLHLPERIDLDINDLRRINIMCLARPLSAWSRERSPAQRTYNDYYQLALAFQKMLRG